MTQDSSSFSLHNLFIKSPCPDAFDVFHFRNEIWVDQSSNYSKTSSIHLTYSEYFCTNFDFAIHFVFKMRFGEASLSIDFASRIAICCRSLGAPSEEFSSAFQNAICLVLSS